MQAVNCRKGQAIDRSERGRKMRSPIGLSRRSALQGITAGGVAVAVTTFGGHPAAGQETTPTGGSQHPLVGTWRTAADPPGPPVGLASYHAGGTMTFVTPSPFPSAPDAGSALTYETAAYGVWESTGERTAAITGTHLYADDQGVYQGTLTFWGMVEIDESGEAYQFTGAFEIADPTGAVQLSDSASTQGQRMGVQFGASVPGTPVATP